VSKRKIILGTVVTVLALAAIGSATNAGDETPTTKPVAEATATPEAGTSFAEFKDRVAAFGDSIARDTDPVVIAIRADDLVAASDKAGILVGHVLNLRDWLDDHTPQSCYSKAYTTAIATTDILYGQYDAMRMLDFDGVNPKTGPAAIEVLVDAMAASTCD